VSVAQLFAHERKFAKGRKWFNRAVTLEPDLGDAWAAWCVSRWRYGDVTR
jgi:pre-mRNA-processing factor 6